MFVRNIVEYCEQLKADELNIVCRKDGTVLCPNSHGQFVRANRLSVIGYRTVYIPVNQYGYVSSYGQKLQEIDVTIVR